MSDEVQLGDYIRYDGISFENRSALVTGIIPPSRACSWTRLVLWTRSGGNDVVDVIDRGSARLDNR